MKSKFVLLTMAPLLADGGGSVTDELPQANGPVDEAPPADAVLAAAGDSPQVPEFENEEEAKEDDAEVPATADAAEAAEA